MSNFKNIKPLSKKLAASLIKNEIPDDMKRFDSFDEKTKAQILSDIKAGKYSNLLKEINTEKDWKTLKRKIQRSKRSKRSFKFWTYGMAASIVLCISITFVFNKTNQKPDFGEPTMINNHIETGTNKAILTLEDGSEVALEKGTPYQTDYVTSNGEEIIYNTATNNEQPDQASKNSSVDYFSEGVSGRVAYNTLTIPRGGQFYILLSDGTKVWLNSESQLKYPVSFTKGKTRQVELVYGEAYFDVSPSTDHKGAKFKVYHRSQEVEVLGTEFNIKAYKDETNIYTTLVEGKVAVNTVIGNEILVPSQQSNLDLQANNMVVTTVEVTSVISWKDGVFDFENKPLKDIMKVLSRWYNMEVIIENKDLENEKFIGSFNKSLPIEDILASIKNTNIINNYEINNKTLTIK